MILIDKKTYAGIPLLEVCEQESFNEKRPAVFFIHGFTSAKEHNLHYAYLLAEKGFRVILPEANFHGERNRGDSEKDMSLQFWNIIVQTIQELEILKNFYVETGKVLVNRIGVAGTSMGGIITLGALTQYDWISCAVSLMGNPCYKKFAQYLVKVAADMGYDIPFTEEQLEEEYRKLERFDLSKQPEKLNIRPLFFWHGKKDTIVPYQYAYSFYESVKEQYKEHPERLTFLLDENAEHKVSREGLLKTVSWFETFLM